MGRIRTLRIKNYRSVRDEITIDFPDAMPLVLIGENNAGKSNIVRALDLVLGEFWPGSHEPEDHEFYDRNKGERQIEILVELDGVFHDDRYKGRRAVDNLRWCWHDAQDRPFQMQFVGGEFSPYVNNEVREQCSCILVGADRRLSYQLSYASKYTFLAKLMKKFHQVLTADTARVQNLKDRFEEIRTLFEGVAEFAEFSQELGRQVGELSGNFEYGLGIDFSAYDPSNYFHALRVHPNQDGDTRTFEELGTGQEQILALSFAHAYAKAFRNTGGLVLVIEEPEAHLHPLAQRWVGYKIRELAREGIQVVVTTHSPAFLDILDLEGFALVRKEDGATKVIQLTKEVLAQYCRATGAAKTTTDIVLPFYAAATTEDILSGFFARKIVLVEGPTEALALPIFFRRVGLDTTKEGIAVIPVGGVGNLAKWWRLFTAFAIPVYTVFDNDANDDPQGTKRHDLLQMLDTVGSESGDLLASGDWIVSKKFCVFGENYEETMRRWFGEEYAARENEGREVFGLHAAQAKPLVARYVASELCLQYYPAGLRKFESLAERIFDLESYDFAHPFSVK